MISFQSGVLFWTQKTNYVLQWNESITNWNEFILIWNEIIPSSNMLFTKTTLEVFWLTLYKKFFEGQVTHIYFEFLKIFRALNSQKNCHIHVWIHSRLEWNHTNLEWIHSTYEWIHDNSGIPILSECQQKFLQGH